MVGRGGGVVGERRVGGYGVLLELEKEMRMLVCFCCFLDGS